MQIIDLTSQRVRDRQIRQTFVNVVGDIVGRPSRVVQPGVAEENDATPKTAGREGQVARVAHVVVLGGEDDGVVRRAVGVHFAAAANKEAAEVVGSTGGRAASRKTLNDRARLDVQNRIAHDVGETRQDIDIGRRPIVGAVQVRGADVKHVVARREETVGAEPRPAVSPVVIRIKGALVVGGAPETVGRRAHSAFKHRATRGRSRIQLTVGSTADRTKLRIGHRVALGRHVLFAVVFVGSALESPEQVVFHVRSRHPVVVDPHPDSTEIGDH